MVLYCLIFNQNIQKLKSQEFNAVDNNKAFNDDYTFKEFNDRLFNQGKL